MIDAGQFESRGLRRIEVLVGWKERHYWVEAPVKRFQNAQTTVVSVCF
jgi:hypothetical protein